MHTVNLRSSLAAGLVAAVTVGAVALPTTAGHPALLSPRIVSGANIAAAGLSYSTSGGIFDSSGREISVIYTGQYGLSVTVDWDLVWNSNQFKVDTSGSVTVAYDYDGKTYDLFSYSWSGVTPYTKVKTDARPGSAVAPTAIATGYVVDELKNGSPAKARNAVVAGYISPRGWNGKVTSSVPGTRLAVSTGAGIEPDTDCGDGCGDVDHTDPAYIPSRAVQAWKSKAAATQTDVAAALADTPAAAELPDTPAVSAAAPQHKAAAGTGDNGPRSRAAHSGARGKRDAG